MMWIFEWDIVTGDSAALDSIYAVSRTDIDAAIAEGAQAPRSPRGCARRLPPPIPRRWRDPGTAPVCSSTPSATRPTCWARSPPTASRCCGACSGSTPARRPPTSSGALRRGVPPRTRRRTWRGTPVTWTCPPTTSPPPTSAPSAPTGTPRWRGWPGCCSLVIAARPAARRPRRPPGRPARGAPGPVRRGDPAVAARPGPGAGGPRAAGPGVGVPAVVLVASRFVYTWFAAPAHLSPTLGGLAGLRGRAAPAASAAVTRSTSGRRSAAWSCCAP